MKRDHTAGTSCFRKLPRVALTLLACAAMSACGGNGSTPEIDRDKPQADETTQGLRADENVYSESWSKTIGANGFHSSVWVDDGFKGKIQRTLGGDWLWASIDQNSEGGMDTAVGNSFQLESASEISENHSVYGKIDFETTTEGGNWWYGPKVSVGWPDNGGKDGNAGWYENYIIDNSTKTAKEWKEKLTGDYFKGTHLGTTEQDGSKYDHYYVPFKSWVQFWSIRQKKRAGGWTNVGKLVKYWIDNGMEDKKLDGIKYNIETRDAQDLEFVISGVKL